MPKPFHLIWLAPLLAATLAGCSTAMFHGADAGVTITDDRRQTSAYVADEGIEYQLAREFDAMAQESSRVVFTSFNKRVLITGQVAEAALREKATELAKKHGDVREVINELAVSGKAGVWQRTTDTYLAMKVKTRMVDDDRLSAKHVKVVTEGDTVYLMGLVKRAEALAAAEVAARTKGVARVVKVFEYLD